MKHAAKQSTVTLILNLCSILMLAASLASFLFSAFSYRMMDRKEKDRYDLSQYASQFLEGSATLTDEIRAYAATGDPGFWDGYQKELMETMSREQGLEGLERIGITDEERALIDEMSGVSDALVPMEDAAASLVAGSDTAGALAQVYGETYNEGIARIHALQSSFLSMLAARTAGEVEALEARSTTAAVVAGILIFCTIAVQLVSSVYIRRRIVTPVVAIQREMGKIADGSLDAAFDLRPDSSEIGLLIDSIHRTKDTLRRIIGDIDRILGAMAQRNMDQRLTMEYIGDFRPIHDALEMILKAMNETLGEVDAAAEGVSSGSDQVSLGAQTLAEGSTEQASAVTELTATIGELVRRMDAIAKNAQEAQSITTGAAGTLERCDREMDALVEAMRGIDQVSSEISEVIGVIESIAFQTNILALNAAVEAARAGAAGKGFAVVADEVRNLANKSQEASRSTAALIEKTAAAVAKGVTIADQTARSIVEVVEGARRSTSCVSEIAASAVEQAAALQQLESGVDQVASVVQTNSATSEQSAAAAKELSSRAEALHELMQSFRLKN